MDQLHYEPDPREIAANPIWSFLQNNGFPWLQTEQQLIKTRNLVKDEFSRDLTVLLENHSPLTENMYKPLQFTVNQTPSNVLPPNFIWGVFTKTGLNSRSHFNAIHNKFRQIFGEGLDTSASNTRSITWTTWPAKLNLTIWPTELNQHGSRAWTDPGREDACYLYIEPGIVLRATQNEIADFYRSIPIKPVDTHDDEIEGMEFLKEMDPPVYIKPIEYYRRIQTADKYFSIDEFANPGFAHLRLSPDRSTLYQAFDTGMHLFPVNRIESVYVERVKPAKGGWRCVFKH